MEVVEEAEGTSMRSCNGFVDTFSAARERCPAVRVVVRELEAEGVEDTVGKQPTSSNVCPTLNTSEGLTSILLWNDNVDVLKSRTEDRRGRSVAERESQKKKWNNYSL